MKIVAIVLSTLLTVIILGAAFMLAPAHIQVREASQASLPTEEDFLALKSIDNGPISIRYITTATQKMVDSTLAHTVFLVEWANGQVFMIDAGMTAERAIEFGEVVESMLDAEPTLPLGTVPELMGDEVKRVSGVGFTHLHIDHTQGIGVFCEAKKSDAQLIQTAYQYSEQNYYTTEGADILASSCLRSEILKSGGLESHSDYPGLGFFPLGGHTPGSTLFALWIGEQLILLSGDTTNSKMEITHNQGKGFLYSYVFVPEDTGRTEILRRWLKKQSEQANTTVIVSHDAQDVIDSGIAEYRKPQ